MTNLELSIEEKVGRATHLRCLQIICLGLGCREIFSALATFVGNWYFLNQLSSPQFLLRCHCCKPHSCHNPLGCRRFPRHFSVYQLIASTFHFQYWVTLAKDGVPLQCSHSQRMGRLQLAEVHTACWGENFFTYIWEICHNDKQQFKQLSSPFQLINLLTLKWKCQLFYKDEWPSLMKNVTAAPYSSTAGHIDRPVTGSSDIVEGEHISTLSCYTGTVHFGRLRLGRSLKVNMRLDYFKWANL